MCSDLSQHAGAAVNKHANNVFVLSCGDCEKTSKPTNTPHLVLELVGVLVLLLVQVDEVVCDLVFGARVHVPADLKRVAGDVADPNVRRHGELHLHHAALLRLTYTHTHKTHDYTGMQY